VLRFWKSSSKTNALIPLCCLFSKVIVENHVPRKIVGRLTSFCRPTVGQLFGWQLTEPFLLRSGCLSEYSLTSGCHRDLSLWSETKSNVNWIISHLYDLEPNTPPSNPITRGFASITIYELTLTSCFEISSFNESILDDRVSFFWNIWTSRFSRLFSLSSLSCKAASLPWLIYLEINRYRSN